MREGLPGTRYAVVLLEPIPTGNCANSCGARTRMCLFDSYSRRTRYSIYMDIDDDDVYDNMMSDGLYILRFSIAGQF